MRAVISHWKNDDVAPEAAAEKAVSHVDEVHATLYAAYERALTRCDALDFDDLILRAVHLLERHDEVRARYAGRFQHVLVDEFQDTNSLQLLLVKLLASEHGNLFAVGDDDQSIYGWRGARVENMLEFEQFFPGTHLFRLEQNYRSTGNILAAANAVIAHNRRRKGKNLWTEAGAGDPLTVEEFLDGEDEAARIVEIVRAEGAAGHTRGDITVLYRTNAQSRLVEDALRRAQIAHQVVGSVQFYERKEVRDILAYLKLVANPADEISLQRIINVPKRRLGETTVERFLAAAAHANLPPGEFSARDDLLEPAVGLAAAGRLRAFFDLVARWRTEANTGALTVPALLARIVKDIDYARLAARGRPRIRRDPPRERGRAGQRRPRLPRRHRRRHPRAVPRADRPGGRRRHHPGRRGRRPPDDHPHGQGPRVPRRDPRRLRGRAAAPRHQQRHRGGRGGGAPALLRRADARAQARLPAARRPPPPLRRPRGLPCRRASWARSPTPSAPAAS